MREADVPVGQRGVVPSPCTSVCRMDEHTGWCEGCLRTIDEIIAWSTLSDAAKHAVWLRLQERRVAVPATGGLRR